jgi:hypothetical protein
MNPKLNKLPRALASPRVVLGSFGSCGFNELSVLLLEVTQWSSIHSVDEVFAADVGPGNRARMIFSFLLCSENGEWIVHLEVLLIPVTALWIDTHCVYVYSETFWK